MLARFASAGFIDWRTFDPTASDGIFLDIYDFFAVPFEWWKISCSNPVWVFLTDVELPVIN